MGVLRTSWKAKLVTLVCVDAVWRLPSLTPTDDALVDIAVVILSLGIEIADVDWLAFVTTWILFGYIAALFAPRAYSNQNQLPPAGGERGFVVLFAITALLSALAIASFMADITDTPTIGSAGSLFFVIILAWVLYLFVWRRWRSTDQYRQLLRNPPDTTQRGDGQMRELIGSVGDVIAGTSMILLPVVLAGVVILLLFLAYPLSDLIVLGGVLLTVLNDRSQTVPDAEQYLFDHLSMASQGIHGMILTWFIALTSIQFVLLYVIGFQALLDLNYGLILSTETLRATPLLGWGLLGFPVTIFACGTYGLWVCYRYLARVSSFVTTPTAGLSTGGSAPSVTARPVGGILPAVLGWVLMTIVADRTSTLGDLSFVLVWPLIIVGLLASVVVTRRRGEHSVGREHHVVVWSLVVMVMVWPVLGVMTEAISPNHWAVYMILPVLWLGYFGHISRIANHADDWRRHSLRLYTVAGAILHGLVAVLASGIARTGLVLITVVLLGGGAIEMWLTDQSVDDWDLSKLDP